ncbi:jg42, partial [Pararge aegeria aegeria]
MCGCYTVLLLLISVFLINGDPSPSFDFNYLNLKDDIYEQPVNLMAPKKNPHAK